MQVDRYAKAIVAGVLAGGTTFEGATGPTGHRLVLALVAAVVTGVTVWGVPNSVTVELKAVESSIERTAMPTEVLPIVGAPVKP